MNIARSSFTFGFPYLFIGTCIWFDLYVATNKPNEI